MATRADFPGKAIHGMAASVRPARLFGLAPILRKAVARGTLTVIDASGKTSRFLGCDDGPDVVIRMTRASLPLWLLLNPPLAAGEAYLDGTLKLEKGTLRDLFGLFGEAGIDLYGHPLNRLRRPFQRLQEARINSVRRSRRNVEHHYDLPDALYALFLDRDRQYSCAYFEHPEQSLEDAQASKRQRLADKLLLEPGQTVLDIGSGWGGLALDLAARHEVVVTGVTLSREQLSWASERAQSAKLMDRVHFAFKDYRQIHSTFDRIVSVGMFEHVGEAHFGDFFKSVERLLKPNGVAVIHSIGRMGPPYETDSFTQKYIFPGGRIPSLSEVMSAIEGTGLWVTDVEILRLHYAETLRYWADRFAANRRTAVQLMGERFCRMWEFYLASAEMSFRTGRLMVFQLQLARMCDAVPVTRDYLYQGLSTAAPSKRPLRRSSSA